MDARKSDSGNVLCRQFQSLETISEFACIYNGVWELVQLQHLRTHYRNR
jgi:hypothetical protein